MLQRRTRQPYGLAGGYPAKSGRNLWIKQLREEDGDLPLADEDDPLSEHFDEKEEETKETGDQQSGRDGDIKQEQPPRIINIGGKATIWVGKGDRLVIETPGGGGWGVPEDEDSNPASVATKLGAGVEKVAEAARDASNKVVEEMKEKYEWAARGSLAERAAAQAGF